MFESHPNVAGLRAIQFDKDKSTSQIYMVRLLFERIKGKHMKDFILDSFADVQKLGML